MSPNDIFTIDKPITPVYTLKVKNVRFADKALEALEKGEGRVISDAVTAAFRKGTGPDKTIVIVGIEDYH